jgi:hypothetical protein
MSGISEEELGDLRQRLVLMILFCEHTPPCGHEHHDRLFWTGKFPAKTWRWEPHKWTEKNPPIWELWDDYKGELASHKMELRLKLANELEASVFASLIETSWQASHTED